MAQVITVTCDGCGTDITNTSAEKGPYRLVMSCQRMFDQWPRRHNAATPERFERKPMEADLHFCDFGCVYRWLDRI